MTAGEEEKSAFPISSPLFPPPPRFFSLLEALGCESHFLSSRQNGPRVSGGGGERVGKEAAAGTGFRFHPGFLLSRRFCGRPRRGELGRAAEGKSSGPATRPPRPGSRRVPAGGTAPAPPLRRLTPKHRRGTAAGPGRALAAGGGPAAQPGVPCGARATGPKRRETLVALILADSARPQCGSRPPSRPECGILRGGGGGWGAAGRR